MKEKAEWMDVKVVCVSLKDKKLHEGVEFKREVGGKRQKDIR